MLASLRHRAVSLCRRGSAFLEVQAGQVELQGQVESAVQEVLAAPADRVLEQALEI